MELARPAKQEESILSDSQKWLLFALVTAIGGLLYLLAPVLTPFLVGMLLAYIGDPLADKLESWKLSRTLSVVAVFLILSLGALVLLLILVPMLERQISLLVSKLPQYLDWLGSTGLPTAADYLGIDDFTFDLAALKELVISQWQDAGGIVKGAIKVISTSGLTLVGWVVNLILILVVTFYLLRDWDILVERVHALLPRRLEPVIVRLVRESDEVLGAFFRGQLMVMFGLGVIYSVGLWIIGLELALLIGMVSGLVSFVPYLGFIIGILSAGIAAVMQFHELMPLLYVVIVFGVAQSVEGMILTPLFVGGRIGLHPVAVIFAVLAGGQLFGFFGILLALPVAAVVMVLLRFAYERYLKSELYSETGSDT